MALVGRAAEQALITETVHRVAAGSGAALLLSGEPGIGKSSLAAYALDEATARGFTTLAARAQPLDRDLAYTIVIEAFGRSLRAATAERRARLVGGLSALTHLFDGIDLPPPQRLDDAVLERTRLFAAVLRLLERMTSAAPVALLVDDLHWADSASAELLAYLARDLPHVPLLLVATYRADAHEPDRPLTGLLQSIRRTGAAREFMLGSLERDEVRALIAGVLRGDPARDLVDEVAGRTGGVPLFVEAFTGWLRETDRLTFRQGRWALRAGGTEGVPPAVEEVIIAELAALPAGARTMLDLVAVGGGNTAPTLLDAVQRQDAPGVDVPRTMAHLVRMGRIVENIDDDVRYAFSHPLWHEVVYGAISAPRRRHLHMLFAEAHESSGDLLGQAAHVMAAGRGLDDPRAVDVLLAAGQQALDRYATEDARKFFAEALSRAERTGGDRVTDALIGLGETLRRSGALGDAARTWRSALARDPDFGDPHERARLYRMIADAESDRGDLTAADRDAEAGLAELASCDPSEEHLELLTVLIISRQRDSDHTGAGRVLDRIERLAPQVATPRARLLLREARIGRLLEQADYAGAAQRLSEVLTTKDPGPGHRFHARFWQVSALIAAVLGDLPALREANQELQVRERDLGVTGWTYRGALYRFVEAFYAGDWDRAADAFDPFTAANRIDNPRVLATAVLVKAMLAAYRAEFDEAERWLNEGRSRVEAGHMPVASGRTILNMVSAIVALERQDPRAALDFIERNDRYFISGVLPPWGLVAEAEARARTGRADAARESIRRLAALGPEGSYPGVMAQRLTGLMHGNSGDPDRGCAALLAARDGFARLGMPFEALRSLIEAAESRTEVEAPLPAAMVEALATAYRTAGDLGAARYAGRAGRLLRASGMALPRSEPVGDGALTPRQLEIAALVAKGLPNTEVAERLCISVRTVTSHLDHIYTRLGISSRAALASYVTERARPGPTHGRLRTFADATDVRGSAP